MTHPIEVSDVLLKEVVSEIERAGPGAHADTLRDIDHADAILSSMIASELFRELSDRPNVCAGCLAPMLRIISRGLSASERPSFTAFCLHRFKDTADPALASLYLKAVFVDGPEVATDAFLQKLDSVSDQTQTILATHAMPAIFGGRFGHEDALSIHAPPSVLERLVIVAYRTIRVDEDNNWPSGEVFSPNTRDDAEGARNNVFGLLTQTPGQATFDAINRFQEVDNFAIPKAHLKELAFERAARDAESAPWNPADLLPFEKTAETAPSTGKDLKHVIIRRLTDIQHDLLHSDFAQGQSVNALPEEVDVQNWIADRLRLKQGQSFSVEREPHVIDEKEPDIRARAKTSDANVAIEIKVAESWTLKQLEAALIEQLCGRYLRAKNGRHGILLLVHQVKRSNGWKTKRKGGLLTFAQVVSHLKELAISVCGASWDGPQPEIAVIDVSSCTRIHARRDKRSRAKGIVEQDRLGTERLPNA